VGNQEKITQFLPAERYAVVIQTPCMWDNSKPGGKCVSILSSVIATIQPSGKNHWDRKTARTSYPSSVKESKNSPYAFQNSVENAVTGHDRLSEVWFYHTFEYHCFKNREGTYLASSM